MRYSENLECIRRELVIAEVQREDGEIIIIHNIL